MSDDDIYGYPEVRFTRFPPDIRQSCEHGPEHIYGYAAAYNKMSRKLGGFVETVMPTAFNEARRDGWPDAIATYTGLDGHRELLGTTYGRTLTLADDETGLVFDVVPPDGLGHVTEYVRRGDIRHSMFAFRVIEEDADEWGLNDYRYPLRTLKQVSLVSVGIVLEPAFSGGALAMARATGGAIESLARHAHADPDEVRKRLREGRGAEFFARKDGGGKKGKK